MQVAIKTLRNDRRLQLAINALTPAVASSRDRQLRSIAYVLGRIASHSVPLVCLWKLRAAVLPGPVHGAVGLLGPAAQLLSDGMVSHGAFGHNV